MANENKNKRYNNYVDLFRNDSKKKTIFSLFFFLLSYSSLLTPVTFWNISAFSKQ